MQNVVDFNRVDPQQVEIHERLENWAKWQRGGHPGNVHPMFRHYRARNAESAPSASAEVDGLDAVAVQKVMKDIPQRHRIAVQWCYVQRGSHVKPCELLGVSKQGLFELIVQGRTMVVNRLRVKEAV
jgi:hypothetical protein